MIAEGLLLGISILHFLSKKANFPCFNHWLGNIVVCYFQKKSFQFILFGTISYFGFRDTEKNDLEFVITADRANDFTLIFVTCTLLNSYSDGASILRFSKGWFSLATESESDLSLKRAYELVKSEYRSRKRSHKLDGIGVGRIRTFLFLPIPFTTPSLMIQ